MIIEKCGVVLIAVDHTNSHPLYYATQDGEFLISDSSTTLKEKTGFNTRSIPATEVLFTYYVTGRDTILEGIQQVLAGECVMFDTSKREVSIRERYHTLDLSGSGQDPAYSEFKSIFERLTERLIEYADGRTICLALSGGYDSRVIGIMLRRLGYENVICYTHDLSTGSPTDIPIASRIADELGYEHVTLSPTHEDFRDFYESERWEEFVDMVDYHCGSPNIHETVVLQLLKEEVDLSEDPIDIRGHLPIPHGSPAFLPRSLEEDRKVSRTEFIETLWEGHYQPWPGNVQDRLRDTLLNRGINALDMGLYEDSETEHSEDIAYAFSQWYCQERTGKYLVFDQETDFVGFDNYYPLWDREYIEYLESLDYSHLIKKDAHKEFARQLTETELGESKFNQANPDTLRLVLWETAKKTVDAMPRPLENRIKEIYRGRRQKWEKVPQLGLVPEDEYKDWNPRYDDPEILYYLLMYRDGRFTLPEKSMLDSALPVSLEHD